MENDALVGMSGPRLDAHLMWKRKPRRTRWKTTRWLERQGRASMRT